MREILFRGYSTVYRKWFYGDLLNCSDGMRISNEESFVAVTKKSVGQFTGLTDKNGKKIFEGDICKHRSNYSGNFIISVVTYTDGCFLAMADNNSGFDLSENLEIIGNIHDNPELLKYESEGKG